MDYAPVYEALASQTIAQLRNKSFGSDNGAYQQQSAASSLLMPFVRATYPKYVTEPVHELIAEHLDRVVSGDIMRLMIFAPPQHGKSELVSVRLPAYWLGKRPDDPVIISSYGADLAYSKSRQARNIVESDEYKAIFPDVVTDRTSRSVSSWSLAGRRGEVRAVGVGGPITGHGALLGIIDDPFENWEQARSETYRNKVRDWYKGTFRTRIWEHGAIVLIMTRWHEDDLAGWLLSTFPEDWTVLRLPATAETQTERDNNNQYLHLPTGEPDPLGRVPGAALAPQRFSIPALQAIARDVGSMVYSAEYQGVPRPSEGNRIKRAWLTHYVDEPPAMAARVRYWDKAGTEGGDGAATAGVLVAVAPDKTITVEDSIQGWWTAGQREAQIKATAERDRQRYGYLIQTWIEQEPGSGGKESADSTIRNLSGYIIYAERPTGDKDTRLEPFAAQAEAGHVQLLRGDWNGAYIEEMVAIPNGKRRDQGDATAGAYNTAVNYRPHGGIHVR